MIPSELFENKCKNECKNGYKKAPLRGTFFVFSGIRPVKRLFYDRDYERWHDRDAKLKHAEVDELMMIRHVERFERLQAAGDGDCAAVMAGNGSGEGFQGIVVAVSWLQDG